jgi:hypothetical protein
VAEKGSFISRFFYKLLEIMGAAVATAVSGYLVAHLGGFLPSQTRTPTPPAVAVAPSERPVPKSVPANALASQPAPPQAAQSAAAPASPDTDHLTGQRQQETTGSAAQPVRKTAKAPPAQPQPRKSGKPETATAATEASRPRETTEAKPREAAEAKPREPTEAKPREATEAKPREAEDKESVEARVRAALANVDANRPAPADVPPRRGDNQGPAAQPRPAETSPNTTAAIPPRPLDPPPASVGPGVQPRSADLGSPAQQPTVQPAAIQSSATQTTAPTPAAPLQVAPVQPTPSQQPDALTTVEIKSRPVATIDPATAPEAAPQQQEERGVLSVFKRILPDLRRPASTDEAPRPPAPVGE